MLQFHPINRYLLSLILVMLIVQIPKFYDQDEIEKCVPILQKMFILYAYDIYSVAARDICMIYERK